MLTDMKAERQLYSEIRQLSSLSFIREQLRNNLSVYYAGELATREHHNAFPDLFKRTDCDLEHEECISHAIFISPKKLISTPAGLNRFKNSLLKIQPTNSRDFDYYIDHGITAKRTKDIEGTENCLTFQVNARKNKQLLTEITQINLYPDPNLAQFMFDGFKALKNKNLSLDDIDDLFLVNQSRLIHEGIIPMPKGEYRTGIDLRERIPHFILIMIKNGQFNYLEYKKKINK